jgi:hypothetical protein
MFFSSGADLTAWKEGQLYAQSSKSCLWNVDCMFMDSLVGSIPVFGRLRL